jgi:sulfopyruvate decarboxylase TPP-binding subunit
MLTGTDVAQCFHEAGITHVVWIPDSELGGWDAALRGQAGLHLIRVSREGEALGVAAGLLLGGRRPVVIMQCTGLFEAGDALRNVVHDLRLPVFMIVGLRGDQAFRQGQTRDTCPRFAEPILAAWAVPFERLDGEQPARQLRAALRDWLTDRQARALLLPE